MLQLAITISFVGVGFGIQAAKEGRYVHPGVLIACCGASGVVMIFA